MTEAKQVTILLITGDQVKIAYIHNHNILTA